MCTREQGTALYTYKFYEIKIPKVYDIELLCDSKHQLKKVKILTKVQDITSLKRSNFT